MHDFNRVIKLISTFALTLVTITGCNSALYTGNNTGAPGQPHPASTTQIAKIIEPAIPAMTPLPVRKTILDELTIQSDVNHLQRLFQGHPGDGIVRGPDQLIYQIDTTIDPKRHEFAAHMSIHFHNNLGQPLHELYFNVWPNAYHYRKAGGYESIANIMLDKKPQKYSLHGTVLSIPLTHEISANGTGVVSMDLLSLMPSTMDRYGWEGSGMNFGNWFPIMAVHDQYGWVTPPYYADGESFYSLTGTFHLHVTAPQNFVLAISGQQNELTYNSNGTNTYSYDAIGVRDVAMVGNSTFRVLSGKAGNTMVVTYYTPNQANQANLMQTVGQHAIESYSQHYGKYPFPTIRIVAMRGWFGGMEYPQLVMISFPQKEIPAQIIATDVAHEVAHQWFFSMIGDDEYLTPWLDEAFATFTERRFDGLLHYFDYLPESSKHISDPVSAFSNDDFGDKTAMDYYNAVYQHGGGMLDDLYHQLGDSKYDAMIQSFFQKYQYQVVTSQDFINAATAAAGTPMDSFFSSRTVDSSDDLQAPELAWAKLEMAENGRTWH